MNDTEILESNMRNQERAATLRIVLDKAFGNGDVKDDITDVLTDILHLCRATDVDFDARLSMAKAHFSEEAN